MLTKIFILILCFYSFTSFACIHGKGFLPENDLNIPDYAGKSVGAGGITESDFNSVIDKLELIYAPIIRSYGGQLQVKRLWSDGTVNARASRQGSTFVVEMFGGLARHESVTKDAFALVACHEVGHHIGGVPRYSGQAGLNWASTEGQSDYFATTKCLRKLFRDDNNESIVSSMNIEPLVKQKCEAQFSVSNDIAICKRISMAGFSASSMFAVMSNRSLPKFDTPDPNVVSQTYESHPAYQCRLDTYFEGAKCEVQDNIEMGQNDPNVGSCNRKDQHSEGLRPLCWFKPTTGGGNDGGNPPPTGGVAKTPNVNGMTSINISNPNQQIRIATDVSGFPGVVGIGIEFSKPNRQFSNPNGTDPDRVNGLRVETYKNIKGTYTLIPSKQFPGWGVYRMRVLALDANKRPISKFSNDLIINISR